MTTTNVIRQASLTPRPGNVDWESLARSCRGALRTLKAEFEIALDQPALSEEELRAELRDAINLIVLLGVT